MGEDELEVKKEREKQLEREARWSAEKTPKPKEPMTMIDSKATPTAVAHFEVPVTVHKSAEDITPIVSEQPRPLKPLPPISTSLLDRNPARQDESPQTRSRITEAPAVEMVDAAPTGEALFPIPTLAEQHDLKELGGSSQPISCPVCDDASHAEEKCPRLEGISIQPTKDMTWFTAEDYVALSRHDRQKR
ncbi:hypothetical protein Slin14017_G123030 [Septoria linicola]|nr:hypothetical protein Slin14017_G123030 [Septoria linicola]